jgi:sulfatase maturation enzyme AslB (radical SAM superfamily)
MNIFLNENPSSLTESLNDHVLNIVFSVNRACNLRCKHCCLSNEYKSSKDHISSEMLDSYCNMLEGWLEKTSHGISHISILMSGGEISLLPDDVFVDYGNKLYEFYQKCSNKFPNIAFSYAILSNLIDLSEIKKTWIVNTYKDSVKNNLIFNLFTSYDKYTDRFHKPLILKKWEDNINWAKENNIAPIVIWSISKKDAQNATEIVQYFEQMDLRVLYVPVLPTGESINNENINPDYDDFIDFLKQIYGYPYKKVMFTEQPKPYQYDRLINLILDQKGFVMFDLLQDLVTEYENTKKFSINNQYIHAKNNHIFIMSQSHEESVDSMDKLWKGFIAQDKKYMKESGCYSCEFFDYCKGGIGTFKPVFHTKEKCAGFKPFLLEYYKESFE